MQVVVKMLSGLSYVERSAWSAVSLSSVQFASNLFDKSRNVTPMGTAYAALRKKRRRILEGGSYSSCQPIELDVEHLLGRDRRPAKRRIVR